MIIIFTKILTNLQSIIIARFTHAEDSDYTQGLEARSRPRSRIPVSVSGAGRTGIKSRSVTQVSQEEMKMKSSGKPLEVTRACKSNIKHERL